MFQPKVGYNFVSSDSVRRDIRLTDINIRSEYVVDISFLLPYVAYLCVIDANHFLNNPDSNKNAMMSSVLIP